MDIPARIDLRHHTSCEESCEGSDNLHHGEDDSPEGGLVSEGSVRCRCEQEFPRSRGRMLRIYLRQEIGREQWLWGSEHAHRVPSN